MNRYVRELGWVWGVGEIVFRKKVIHGLGYQVLHALLGVLGLYQFERRSCLYGKPGANHYPTLAGGSIAGWWLRPLARDSGFGIADGLLFKSGCQKVRLWFAHRVYLCCCVI